MKTEIKKIDQEYVKTIIWDNNITMENKAFSATDLFNILIKKGILKEEDLLL